MHSSIKMPATVLLVIAYLFTSCLISIVPVSGRLRRAMRIRNTSFFSGNMLKLFNIKIHLKHVERLNTLRGGSLVVSNHLSYLDVLVISSLLPSAFITSVELKHAFLLGALTRFGGCIFVERRKPAGLKREIEEIVRVLGEGFPVVLFPEGTTSSGDRVQPFKNALFDAAISARTDILPLCLRYTKIDGTDLTVRNRDSVFYYGGATFFRHLPRFLALKSVEVDVMPQEAIGVRGHASRKELAAKAHTLVSAAYQEQMKV